jgi:hypothetical protein
LGYGGRKLVLVGRDYGWFLSMSATIVFTWERVHIELLMRFAFVITNQRKKVGKLASLVKWQRLFYVHLKFSLFYFLFF